MLFYGNVDSLATRDWLKTCHDNTALKWVKFQDLGANLRQLFTVKKSLMIKDDEPQSVVALESLRENTRKSFIPTSHRYKALMPSQNCI